MANKYQTVILPMGISLLIITSIIACVNEEYAHFTDFKLFMAQEHQIDLSQTSDQIYYVIPFSSCNTCSSTSLNLELLDKKSRTTNKERLTIILSGKIDARSYQKAINELTTSYTMIWDAHNMIDRYQTGISKPILLHIKNGKVKKYFKINDLDIDAVGQYLDSAI